MSRISTALEATSMLTLSITLVFVIFLASVATENPDEYKPAHSLGTGRNDWWITYPDQNTNAGSPVQHPKWILEALRENPVLILDHTEDCKSCNIQIANIEKILKSYNQELIYYDILADARDKRAFEVLGIYSPSGGPSYVPTTVFITLMKSSKGNVSIAWHSVEDAMNEDQLNEYARDAIYYYRQNSADWIKG